MAIGWSVGQIITANRLNNRLPIYATKAADTSRSSSTTFTDDPELTVTLKAGFTYSLTGHLIVLGASNTPDFRHQLNWTNTATVVYNAHGLDRTGTSYSGSIDAFATSRDATTPAGIYTHLTTTSNTTILVSGYVDVGASADTVVTLQWCQNTSSADATTLVNGSTLTFTPIDY